jgi:AraC family transcriptional regulator of adaptative response/methylated-DNA-[protein]-cysteine methyltransferase
MREIIRFAWGISSLGDFVVATSDKGLVAVEFGSNHPATEDALRARFPEADVIDGRQGLSDVLGRVSRAIEEPGFDAAVPLDLRGTPYQVEVWSMLRAIPVGETTTYGALAAKLGTRDAREVTDAIACNPIAVLVPCHRVIKKDGSIAGYRWGFKRKRALLAREQHSGPSNLSETLQCYDADAGDGGGPEIKAGFVVMNADVLDRPFAINELTHSRFLDSRVSLLEYRRPSRCQHTLRLFVGKMRLSQLRCVCRAYSRRAA